MRSWQTTTCCAAGPCMHAGPSGHRPSLLHQAQPPEHASVANWHGKTMQHANRLQHRMKVCQSLLSNMRLTSTAPCCNNCTLTTATPVQTCSNISRSACMQARTRMHILQRCHQAFGISHAHASLPAHPSQCGQTSMQRLCRAVQGVAGRASLPSKKLLQQEASGSAGGAIPEASLSPHPRH